MRYCSVLNCSNNSGKPSTVSNSISFHYFPKDPETRQAWTYATGRLNWAPQKYSTICSEHFTEYDFSMRNGKRFLRSTTVPRFNLNEQSSRYSESQYNNETQAALAFLTGQMYPENQLPIQQESEVDTIQDIDQLPIQQEEVVTTQEIDQLPIQQEAEVVTLQVIGGKNPTVVVKKPLIKPQTTTSPPEKKPKYFSIVNNFKSEAQLKAEKDKILELVHKNVDPEISKILITLDTLNEKKIGTNGGTTNQPRSKTGQFIKKIKEPVEHYPDNLTLSQLKYKLKQKDLIISRQKLTIRDLLKSQLKDKTLIKSLEIRLNSIKNNEASTNELAVQTPKLSIPFKNTTQQQIATQKLQSKKTTNLKNLHQSNSNFSDQDEVYYDSQNGRSKVGLKRPAPQQIVIKKRHKIENTNSENLPQSHRNFSGQDQVFFDTQNTQSKVGFKKPAPPQKITTKQRMEATNSEKLHQSDRVFSDQYDSQNAHLKVGFKRPAPQQNVIIQSQEILVPPNIKNRSQPSMIFSEQDRRHFWQF